MAQQQQPIIKPITLTILPVNNPPILDTAYQGHVPILKEQEPPKSTGVYIPPPSYTVNTFTTNNVSPKVHQMTPEEKIENRKRINREGQRRYREKTKNFTGIVKLPTINDRIRELWYLTYPDSPIDQTRLDNLIMEFVQQAIIASRETY